MPNISEYRCEQAWNAGVKAALAEKKRSSNNRQPGTVYYDDWADGYDSVANDWSDEKHSRLCAVPA